MSKIYLGNAFSLQMVETPTLISVKEVAVEYIAAAKFESVVGHPDTAAVLTTMLGKEVTPNRVSVALNKGDVLYVAQLVGGRLPEGATKLPEGFPSNFWRSHSNKLHDKEKSLKPELTDCRFESYPTALSQVVAICDDKMGR